jgi:hypothetical protein
MAARIARAAPFLQAFRLASSASYLSMVIATGFAQALSSAV